MLESLELNNIGPSAHVQMEFGKRLTLLTGDNGLGKSFILDCAWWALTRTWPAELNAKMTSGEIIRPLKKGPAEISFRYSGVIKSETYTSEYQRDRDEWKIRRGRPTNPGLVIYAMADGSFAVWDPERVSKNAKDERVPAFIFSLKDLWSVPEKIPFCNGIMLDWLFWQIEKGQTFQELTKVLAQLCPPDEPFEVGDFAIVSVSDPRDKPTLRMAYGQDVPLNNLSAGYRRIISLAYVLIWTWDLHRRMSKAADKPPTKQVIFLFDEIEAHLHPSWQSHIVNALLKVVDSLITEAEVQLIAATHSPLIMASLETVFDPDRDAWYDIERTGTKVDVSRKRFVPQGDFSQWLVSDAFGLPAARNPEINKRIQQIGELLYQEPLDHQRIISEFNWLNTHLNPKDSQLLRTRFLCEKLGVPV